MLKIYLFTIEIAVLSTLIAFVIGMSAAFFTARRSFVFRKLLLSFCAIPLCVPPLIIALGYVGFFGVSGTFNNLMQRIALMLKLQLEPTKLLYTTAGVVVAQGFYNFPFVTGIVNDAWLALPKEQENAARILGASEKRIFFTITMPRLGGAIGAAVIPVFLFCFFSFMIVLLFSPGGKSTLEVEVYHSIKMTMGYVTGAKLAALETVTAMLVVFIYSFIVRKSQTTSEGVLFVAKNMPKIGKAPFFSLSQKFFEYLFFVTLSLLIILFFVFPGINIITSAFSQTRNRVTTYGIMQFSRLFTSKAFYSALVNTVWIGIVTGILCTAVAFIYSVCVKLNNKQGSVVLQTVPLISMAVSSVVLGWIFTLIFHRGSILHLILIQTFLYWPIAYRQIQNGMNRISLETDRAALMLSKNKLDSVFRVYLPSCKPVLITGFCYSFSCSVGDSSLPLVLSIPRFNNLALYTYRLAGSYRFDAACACGLVLIGLTGTVLALTSLFYANRKAF